MKNILSVIMFLSFLIPAITYSQNWNAVCVGINDYPGTYNDLQDCVNDATSMKYYLETYKHWSSNRVNRIIDGAASENGIQIAMANMSTSTGNTNFFHFSGHGDSRELGIEYGTPGIDGLIPSNSIDARITQNELQTNFGSTYNQCTAFLDACGCGIFPRDMTIGVISSAVKADELASEGYNDHGYFTYYLLDGLTHSTINTAEQLHNYAAPLTTNLAYDFNPDYPQHPQLGDRFNGYLSIYNAPYTVSGTLQRYETWSGSITITGNVTIPSGIALTISSGATVTFNSGVKLIVNGGGTLIANGATFRGNGSAGSWNSIWFAANSYGTIQSCTIRDAQCGIYATSNANITVSNCTITNNSIYGFSILSNATVNISNCTISSSHTGINISSSLVTITGNTFLNNSSYSINANSIASLQPLYWHDNTFQSNGPLLLNNAGVHLYFYNNIISSSSGVYVTSSSPDFGNPADHSHGYNAITCAGSPLVKADNYSSLSMGHAPEGGYNSIYGSDLPDMESLNHSIIWADYNYWGSPYPQVYADGTSQITTVGPLNYDPNPPCNGMLKQSTSLAKINSEPNSDISTKYWEAISEFKEGNYSTAATLLKSIISGAYDDKYSPLALLSLYDCKLKLFNSTASDSSINQDWKSITKNLSESSGNSLKPFSIRLLAREAASSNDYSNANIYYKKLISEYPNSEHELVGLYNLFIYYIIENDFAHAKSYLDRMENGYPKEDLTKFAEIDYGNGTTSTMPKISNEKEASNSQEFDLSNAYPNPFNPTTIINYTLPLDEKVNIKVFDILGKEVAELVNEEKPAGKYSVQFDASKLSSGIYFYSITAGNYHLTKKLLLVK